MGTAGKEDFGSGQLIHDLHLSELAKYPKHNAKAVLLSLLQCVPDTMDTEIILESTAKGIGGEFYSRFWGARYRYTFYLEDGKAKFKKEINSDANTSNEYNAIFIPWFVFSEYRMPVREELVYSEQEQILKKLYNLDDEQLTWRRFILEYKCDGDVNLFNQEYPADPMSGFVSVPLRVPVAVPAGVPGRWRTPPGTGTCIKVLERFCDRLLPFMPALSQFFDLRGGTPSPPPAPPWVATARRL